MSFFITCLSTIGDWIAGKAIPLVINFIIDKIPVIGKFLTSIFGIKLLIILSIVVVTIIVIQKIYETYQRAKNNYKDDIIITGLDKMKEKLNKNQGGPAKIENRCYAFKKEINYKVNKLINESNVAEDKKDSMNTFIGSVFSSITESFNGGENKVSDSITLYMDKTTMFSLQKEMKMIRITFSFDDNIFFEYLSLLLKLLKNEYQLLKNYEEEFKNYYVNKECPMRMIEISIKK